MTTTNLKRIETGHYETGDGHYRVVHFAGEWALEDTAGHHSLLRGHGPHLPATRTDMLCFRTLRLAASHLDELYESVEV